MREALGLSADLIRKYNQPAPRYTSYPTALKFQTIEDERRGEALLGDLEDAEGPLSLYFHLPYCRSLCWFCGCAKEGDPIVSAQRAKTLQRNFQGYGLHADVDICAFGMSSISQSANSFRQNHKNLDTYYAMLDDGKLPLDKGYLLTRDDQIRREVIMRLMCDLELDFKRRGQRYGIDFEAYFAGELAELRFLEKDGLLVFEAAGLKVTPLGRLLIRNVAARFDACLGPGVKEFSKAI